MRGSPRQSAAIGRKGPSAFAPVRAATRLRADAGLRAAVSRACARAQAKAIKHGDKRLDRHSAMDGRGEKKGGAGAHAWGTAMDQSPALDDRADDGGEELRAPTGGPTLGDFVTVN